MNMRQYDHSVKSFDFLLLLVSHQRFPNHRVIFAAEAAAAAVENEDKSLVYAKV